MTSNHWINPKNGFFVLVSAIAGIALYGGSAVQLISTNTVSCTSMTGCAAYRWEPSSSVGSTWVTSWTELNAGDTTKPNYTSSWNGSWSTPYVHNYGTSYLGNVSLIYNPFQANHEFLGISLDSYCHLVFQASTNSAGTAWNNMVQVGTAAADYPSLAVASSGLMVAGANISTCFSVSGYQTYVSSNGGATWLGPFTLETTSYQSFGRLVAVGSTFYYFYSDTTNPPNFQLKVTQSTNGMNWSVPTVLNTYSAPKRSSDPTTFCNGANCGVIYYSANIDAHASSAGWVVVYPAAPSSNPAINNLMYCAQNLNGCLTIIYPIDLFAGGVSTSSSGDAWFSMLTYSGSPNRILPLNMIGLYRGSNGNSVGGFVEYNINPTSWFYGVNFPICSTPQKVLSCFTGGDFFRISSNTVTGASLPFIAGPTSRLTDMDQAFVQDPGVGLAPVPGLTVGPVIPFGSDSTYKGTWSAADIAARTPTNASSISSLLQP